MKLIKREFRLQPWGHWRHFALFFWMYGITDHMQHITKSWQIGYCLYWLNKPWTWFKCYTNGAVKGRDRCYGWHLHLFAFSFEYYNYDYDKV